MKEEQFTLEEQVFRFEKEETSWRLDLKRSEVDSQDLRNFMDFGSPSSLVFRAKHDSGSRPDSSDLSD